MTLENQQKKKLPSPIFHYIDGGSDDEVTLNRNTESFNDCDLIPNVLSDVSNIDLSNHAIGVYNLIIETNDKRYTKKIIKQ